MVGETLKGPLVSRASIFLTISAPCSRVIPANRSYRMQTSTDCGVLEKLPLLHRPPLVRRSVSQRYGSNYTPMAGIKQSIILKMFVVYCKIGIKEWK